MPAEQENTSSSPETSALTNRFARYRPYSERGPDAPRFPRLFPHFWTYCSKCRSLLADCYCD